MPIGHHKSFIDKDNICSQKSLLDFILNDKRSSEEIHCGFIEEYQHNKDNDQKMQDVHNQIIVNQSTGRDVIKNFELNPGHYLDFP